MNLKDADVLARYFDRQADQLEEQAIEFRAQARAIRQQVADVRAAMKQHA